METTIQSLVLADATREEIERWCRDRTQSYVIPMGEHLTPVLVARVLGRYIMTLEARDVVIAPRLALDGIWEPWVTMAIARHLKSGMACMDVGACDGYYTLLMADIVGPSGRVQAWEPTTNGVQRNADANGLTVAFKKRALGRAAQLNFPLIPRVVKRLFNVGTLPFEEAPLSPPVVADPEPFDFIKVDVNGDNQRVWDALENVRRVSRSLTLCWEYDEDASAEFLQAVVHDGFQLGRVDPDGYPRPCSLGDITGSSETQWLWLKKEQAIT